MSGLTRRSFLAGTAAMLAAPVPRAIALGRRLAGTVRFGVIADPHHGLAPDAQQRLQAFVDAAIERSDLDFIVQLGDFCHPRDDSIPFLAEFDRFPGARHHVLGNHDMDLGTKAQTMKHWGIEKPYYAFDAGPLRFVVLDLNTLRRGTAYEPYGNANFYAEGIERNWCDPAQLEWLDAQLRTVKRPTIIFSHQPIGLSTRGTWLPRQQRAILEVIDGARANPEAADVLACMSGHLHLDFAQRVKGIYCLSVNSASYHWSGGMRPYADPLFAFVTIDGEGRLLIEGQRSSFTEGHPWANGQSRDLEGVTASISDRAVLLGRGGS